MKKCYRRHLYFAIQIFRIKVTQIRVFLLFSSTCDCTLHSYRWYHQIRNYNAKCLNLMSTIFISFFFILLIKLTFKLKVSFLPVAVIVLQEFIAFEDHMPCCWPYRLQSMRSSLWSSGGLTKNKVTEKFSGKVFCPLSLWALSIWFFRSLSESCLPAIGNRGPWGPLEANIEVCDVMVAWLFIVVVVSCPSMVGPIPWLRLLPSNGWWFGWVGGNTPAGCPLVLTLKNKKNVN